MTAWTCPHCGATSRHPDDVKNRYCGRCHHYCDTTPLPWECRHCQSVNSDNGKTVQYCGACGRQWDDMPEDEFDAWIRELRPPANEPGGPLP